MRSVLLKLDVFVKYNAYTRILASFSIILIATLIRIFLLRSLNDEVPYLLFYPAVTAVAVYLGFWHGIFAIFLSAYFVIYRWSLFSDVPIIIERVDWIILVIFCINCVFISWLSQQLLDTQKLAEKASNLKSAFISNISHEIRTPLNAISGFANLLGKKELSDVKRKNYLQILNENINILIGIISDVLDISIIESDQIKIYKEHVDVDAFIAKTCDVHKASAKNKNIEIVCKKSQTGVKNILFTDRTKLSQILNNLLINAIKFSKANKITIGYTIRNQEMEFCVSDNGVGIAPKFHESIFDRFNRIELETSNTGTGLGLTISKGLIEKLGGKIWLNSKLGEGAKFFFTIPITKAPLDEQNKNFNTLSMKTPETIRDNYSDVKVLIAEDEDFNYLILSEMLNEQKITSIRAKTGIEAITIFKENPDVDLILMDIKMPEMNGQDAFKKIREFNNDVPIIAQTAYSFSEEINKIKQHGFTDVISKPIMEEDLIELLRLYLP